MGMGDALDERGTRALRARRRRRRRAIGVVVFVLVVVAIVVLAASMFTGSSDSDHTSGGSSTTNTAAATTTTLPLAGPFKVTADVNVRDGPGTNFPVHTTLQPGTMVKVQCQALGQVVNGPNGANAKWVKIVGYLVTGYVTTVYVDVGTALDDTTKVPVCPRA
jgi:hypothetical protein